MDEQYAAYALERSCAPDGRLVCSTGTGDIHQEFVADLLISSEGCCQHCNEPSGSIKGEICLE